MGGLRLPRWTGFCFKPGGPDRGDPTVCIRLSVRRHRFDRLPMQIDPHSAGGHDLLIRQPATMLLHHAEQRPRPPTIHALTVDPSPQILPGGQRQRAKVGIIQRKDGVEAQVRFTITTGLGFAFGHQQFLADGLWSPCDQATAHK